MRLSKYQDQRRWNEDDCPSYIWFPLPIKKCLALYEGEPGEGSALLEGHLDGLQEGSVLKEGELDEPPLDSRGQQVEL
jgi:hypothetical protein